MTRQTVVALFPEASFGAALNCVGVAQALRDQGARPVFICHEGFQGVFAEYGFQEYTLTPGTAASAAEQEHYWENFIARHKPHFRLSPIEQIEPYVVPAWEAIVQTAIEAERPLRRLLARLRPDAIVLDNVVMFPAIRQAGIPWIRMVSCAETEIPDPAVPPYLSGCATGDDTGRRNFLRAYERAIAPVHARYNKFLTECGLPPYPLGRFLEMSPHLNLLLAPDAVRFERAEPLDPQRFVYLDGCVRTEAPFSPPPFPKHNDRPLVYVSFGSLGAIDVELFKAMMTTFSSLPYRFLVNVGAYQDSYAAVPDNVYLDGWFPQPSVVRQSDLFIHHGGNNSLCEALYFGVPSLVLPYCWDGHDNARRVEECGVGRAMPRYDWTPDQLSEAIHQLVTDDALRNRLRQIGKRMRAAKGTRLAASSVLALTDGSSAMHRPDGRRGRHSGADEYVGSRTSRRGGAGA